jgi:hypothetical protein
LTAEPLKQHHRDVDVALPRLDHPRAELVEIGLIESP